VNFAIILLQKFKILNSNHSIFGVFYFILYSSCFEGSFFELKKLLVPFKLQNILGTKCSNSIVEMLKN